MAYLGQGKDMKACNMESFADEIDLQVKDGQEMMRCSANMSLIGWPSCGQSTRNSSRRNCWWCCRQIFVAQHCRWKTWQPNPNSVLVDYIFNLAACSGTWKLVFPFIIPFRQANSMGVIKLRYPGTVSKSDPMEWFEYRKLPKSHPKSLAEIIGSPTCSLGFASRLLSKLINKHMLTPIFPRVFGQNSGHGFLAWRDNDQHVSTLFSQLITSHDFTRRKKTIKKEDAQIWATRWVICNHTQLHSNGKLEIWRTERQHFFLASQPISLLGQRHVPHVPGGLVAMPRHPSHRPPRSATSPCRMSRTWWRN